MVTDRINDFLRTTRSDEPFVVVDLEVVRKNFERLARALPESRVYYAVKANPAPEILALLAKLGSSLDTASVAEIEMVLAAGARADRTAYGNTVRKERDIARAHALGLPGGDRVAWHALLRAGTGLGRISPEPVRSPRRGGTRPAAAAC